MHMRALLLIAILGLAGCQTASRTGDVVSETVREHPETVVGTGVGAAGGAVVGGVVGWLANLLSLIFFVWFGLESYEFAAFPYLIDARSDIARLPLVPWMALLPASSLLVALILLAQLLRSLSGVDDGEEAEGRGAL